MEILLACILDLILGDPAFPPHPVVVMGRIISWAEKVLRRIFENPDLLDEPIETEIEI